MLLSVCISYIFPSSSLTLITQPPLRCISYWLSLSLSCSFHFLILLFYSYDTLSYLLCFLFYLVYPWVFRFSSQSPNDIRILLYINFHLYMKQRQQTNIISTTSGIYLKNRGTLALTISTTTYNEFHEMKILICIYVTIINFLYIFQVYNKHII